MDTHDVHVLDTLRQRSQSGETTEELSHSLLGLLSPRNASMTAVSFGDDVRKMAVRLADSTMIHGGGVAPEERLRGARFLAAGLHVAAGRRVHLIAPDEHQARREGELASALFVSLDVKVAILSNDMSPAEREAAYAADITVGAYRRFALDLLHDRLAGKADAHLESNGRAAVVLDPGQVLITPIVDPVALTERDPTPVQTLRKVARATAGLNAGEDFVLDAERKVAQLTPRGQLRVREAYGVTDSLDVEALMLERRAIEAVAAAHLYRRERDYEVTGDALQLVAPDSWPQGTRLRGGLLQAIEIKEGLSVSDTEWITALISVFEYCRRYSHVGGTSSAEIMFATELEELFGLRVWDRRSSEELGPQQQYADGMAQYLDLNRQLAQWNRLGQQQRAALCKLQTRTHRDLDSILQDAVQAALSNLLEQSEGNPGHALVQLMPSLQQVAHNADSLTSRDAVWAQARFRCMQNLDSNPEGQRKAVQSAIHQMAVYQIWSEYHLRDLHWPHDLAEFELSLVGVSERMQLKFQHAVASNALA